MTRHRGIVCRALTWNLFHGRDHPPDPALLTVRSRLLRTPELGDTHLQVNRPLLGAFAAVLAREAWDVALLQEAPPRWLVPLARATGAGGVSALTSRNFGAAARAWLADRNPDLIASGEGGSNQLLVRPPWRVERVERVTIIRRPERRRMLLARLRHPAGAVLVVACLHTSAHDHRASAREVEWAAARAAAFAGGAPLIFGGDLNVRSGTQPAVFEALRELHGLAPPTSAESLDHLLSRDLELESPPAALPPDRHEIPSSDVVPGFADGLAVRLSDHSPVVASFAVR